MSGALFRHHVIVRVRISATKAGRSKTQQHGVSTNAINLRPSAAASHATRSSALVNHGEKSRTSPNKNVQSRAFNSGAIAQGDGSTLSPPSSATPSRDTRNRTFGTGFSGQQSGGGTRAGLHPGGSRSGGGDLSGSQMLAGVQSGGEKAGGTFGGGSAPLSGTGGGGSRAYGSSSVQALSNGTARRVGNGQPAPTRVDAVVVGAGQAGLSVAYHLQRAGGMRFVTLDANQEAGGAWRHRWPSLQLFSTRKWSSLPGYPMFANGACEDGYPSTREMAMYMEEYESVMKLNVVRPVAVTGVTRTTMGTYLVETDCLLGGAPARWECRAVISATGTHNTPLWPRLPGVETFRGVQIHSSQYRNVEDFRGARVVVVGGGNSGAQILAEVSQPGMAASTLWSAELPPSFLPKDLPGKEIFDTVARLRQQQGFVRSEQIPSLHSIIMQPGVLEASERGVYDHHLPALTRFTPTGVAWDAATVTDEKGETRTLPAGEAEVDAIIWCTGYASNTSHLARLGIVKENSEIAMNDADMGETADQRGIFAVGYGNWAGVGSGSIPGATMYAKRAASAAIHHLRGETAFSTANQYAARATSALLSSDSPTASAGWPRAGRAMANAWPSTGRITVNRSDDRTGATASPAGSGGMVSVAA